MPNLNIKKLIDINNKILRDNCKTIEFISISWLYIKRLHPHYLKNYNILDKSIFMISLNTIFVFFINFIKFCNLILKSLITKKIKAKIDQRILIISHYINNHNYSKSDFYYDRLEKYFRNKKLLTKTILINDQKKIKKINPNYILLSNTLKTYDLFLIFCKQLNLIPKIINKYFYSSNKLEKKILLVLISRTICSSTLFNLIKYRQLFEILKKTNLQMCFCNFEGNAIERIIFKAVSDSNKNIIKIGYSHTTDFPMRNSVFLKLDKNLMPDYLFLNSNVVYNKFKLRGFSNLILSGLLKGTEINSFSIKENKNNKTILLIPEGIKDELDKFINFVKDTSKQLVDYKFIIRPHPVLDLSEIIKTKMIYISKNSLQYDIQHSKYVIFRGSTLIINCISNNLIPIYLNLGENYDFHIFPDHLKDKLNIIDNSNINNINLKKCILDHKLKDFTKNYFINYDENEINNFLLKTIYS